MELLYKQVDVFDPTVGDLFQLPVELVTQWTNQLCSFPHVYHTAERAGTLGLFLLEGIKEHGFHQPVTSDIVGDAFLLDHVVGCQQLKQDAAANMSKARPCSGIWVWYEVCNLSLTAGFSE